jgi:hypothetical protein
MQRSVRLQRQNFHCRGSEDYNVYGKDFHNQEVMSLETINDLTLTFFNEGCCVSQG